MTAGTSNYMARKQWTPVGAIDELNIDSDNDTWEFVFPHPVDAYRVAFLATTAVVHNSADVDVEIYLTTDAGDAGTDTLVGTWKPLLNGETLAVGDWTVGNLVLADTDGSTAVDGNTVYEGPDGPVSVPMGGGLTFKVVVPSASGAGRIALEYVEKPMMSDEDGTGVARIHNVPAA